MAFTSVTVTGKWVDNSGNPKMGTVTFQLSTELSNPNGTPSMVPASEYPVTLNSQGQISVTLQAVNDTNTTPTGAVWNVLEQIQGAPPVRYAVSITTAMAPTVDLSSLTRLSPSLPPVLGT